MCSTTLVESSRVLCNLGIVPHEEQWSPDRVGFSCGNMVWLLISLLPSQSPLCSSEGLTLTNMCALDSTLECFHCPIWDKCSHHHHCHLTPFSAEETKIKEIKGLLQITQWQGIWIQTASLQSLSSQPGI